MSPLLILGLIALVALISIGGTMWWMNSNIYAKPFDPTELNKREQATLDEKFDRLEQSAMSAKPANAAPVPPGGPLKPEAYSEDDAKRLVEFTERELNSLIANDRYMAQRVAVDLADDLVSVKLLMPMDQDLPILGGKTLRFNFGVTLGYANGKPIVTPRGISLGGVPIPSAWWGGIKNQNLVEHFGQEGGFWDQFSKGVENISVKDGHLQIKLKE